jgi:hypothetical protein
MITQRATETKAYAPEHRALGDSLSRDSLSQEIRGVSKTAIEALCQTLLGTSARTAKRNIGSCAWKHRQRTIIRRFA